MFCSRMSAGMTRRLPCTSARRCMRRRPRAQRGCWPCSAQCSTPQPGGGPRKRAAYVEPARGAQQQHGFGSAPTQAAPKGSWALPQQGAPATRPHLRRTLSQLFHPPPPTPHPTHNPPLFPTVTHTCRRPWRPPPPRGPLPCLPPRPHLRRTLGHLLAALVPHDDAPGLLAVKAHALRHIIAARVEGRGSGSGWLVFEAARAA